MHLSEVYETSRGMPQDGVLPSFLRLLHFDLLFAWLVEARRFWAERYKDTRGLELYFADDTAFAIAGMRPEKVALAAGELAEHIRVSLTKFGLVRSILKSVSLFVDPGRLIGLVFRRPGSGRRTGVAGREGRDERLERAFQLRALRGERTAELFPDELLGRLFFSHIDAVGSLGGLFDARLTFQPHITPGLNKACIRQGILARLAGSTWGPVVSILRITQEALLTSLVRYGLITYCSGAHETGLHGLNTQLINIAARRTAGIPRAARVVVPHIMADVVSAPNLYSPQSAKSLHSIMGATSSTIQLVLRTWACDAYRMPHWETTRSCFAPQRPSGFTGVRGNRELGVTVRWGACTA